MTQRSLRYRAGYGAAIAVVLFLIMSIYIALFLRRTLAHEDGAHDVPSPIMHAPLRSRIGYRVALS